MVCWPLLEEDLSRQMKMSYSNYIDPWREYTWCTGSNLGLLPCSCHIGGVVVFTRLVPVTLSRPRPLFLKSSKN